MMKFDIYTYTSHGGREYNEDFADQCVEGDRAFFVLADGLGGHQGGSLASRCVAEALTEAWKNAEKEEEMPWEVWLEEQIAGANEKLLHLQRKKRGRMKSTIAALCLDRDTAAWTHVGDSRIYRLSEGRIACLTEDHSVTYKKYKSGEIRREDINFDEDRSSLLRAVGDREHCVPDCGSMETGEKLRPGDAFLLCSDGFWEYLYEEEILIDCLKSESAREWGDLMMLRVMQRIMPDSDNLTFSAVRIQDGDTVRFAGQRRRKKDE